MMISVVINDLCTNMTISHYMTLLFFFFSVPSSIGKCKIVRRHPQGNLPVIHRPRTRSAVTIWSLPEELLLHLLKGLHVKDLLNMRAVSISSDQGLSRLCVQRVIWTHRTQFFDSLDTQKFMSEFADDDFS